VPAGCSGVQWGCGQRSRARTVVTWRQRPPSMACDSSRTSARPQGGVACAVLQLHTCMQLCVAVDRPRAPPYLVWRRRHDAVAPSTLHARRRVVQTQCRAGLPAAGSGVAVWLIMRVRGRPGSSTDVRRVARTFAAAAAHKRAARRTHLLAACRLSCAPLRPNPSPTRSGS
jgi:hypothetical protein